MRLFPYFLATALFFHGALPLRAETPLQRLEELWQGKGIEGDQLHLAYGSVAPLALSRNLQLKSSTLEVPIAQSRYHQALAARNPTLSSNVYYAHIAQNVVEQNLNNNRFILLAAGNPSDPANLYTLGQNQLLNRTSLYIPVYTGGRLESNMHLQAALTEAARQDTQRARQLLTYQAKQQYLQTSLASENARLAHLVLNQAQEFLGYAQTRLNSGVGTKLDVLQAEVAVANANDAVIQTSSSFVKTKADLAGLVDVPLLTDFALKEDLTAPELLQQEQTPAGTILSLTELALRQRPELVKLNYEMKANRESDNIAQADARPQLAVSLNYDVLGNPSQLAGGPSIMATVSIPIFDGGVSSAKSREFQARGLLLNNESARLTQQIAVDVRNALLAVDEANSRVELNQATETQAAEAVRIATLRYQIGAGTSLDLLDAQNALANARFALADARYRQILSRASLNLAIGTSPPDTGSEPAQ